MTFSSYDPRKIIRSTIGTTGYTDDDDTYYYLSVTDDVSDTVKVPIYMGEEVKSGSLPNMPYITFRSMTTRYDVGDVGGRIYEHYAYIDAMVEFTDMENIDRTSFGKKIIDELVDKVRTYQSIITGVQFLDIIGVRQFDVPYGHQVVYTYVVELRAWYNDACDV